MRSTMAWASAWARCMEFIGMETKSCVECGLKIVPGLLRLAVGGRSVKDRVTFVCVAISSSIHIIDVKLRRVFMVLLDDVGGIVNMLRWVD